MDGLSSATTVVSVLQLAWQVVEYVKAIRGAREDRQKLLLELIRARGLLSTLNYLPQDVGDKNWSRALQSLVGPDGPIVAFQVLLEDVVDELGVVRACEKETKADQSTAVESKSKLRLSRFFHHHHEKKATEASSSSGSLKASGSSSEPRNGENNRSVSLKITAAIRDLTWPYTQNHLLELFTSLQRIKTHFLVALTSDNVRLSQVIHSELGTVRSEVLLFSVNVKFATPVNFVESFFLVFQWYLTLHDIHELKTTFSWPSDPSSYFDSSLLAKFSHTGV